MKIENLLKTNVNDHVEKRTIYPTFLGLGRGLRL